MARLPGDQAGPLPAARAANHTTRLTRADLKGIASVPSPNQTRPSEPRWQQRLLHGVEAASELDQAPQPQVRQGWHGASLPHGPAAQSHGAGQAPALRSRKPGLGVTAGNPSAASEPDADDQATGAAADRATRSTDAGDGELSGRRPSRAVMRSCNRARARWPENHLDSPVAATGVARGPAAGCSRRRSRGRASRWASRSATVRRRGEGRRGRPRPRAPGCRRTGSRSLRRPGPAAE